MLAAGAEIDEFGDAVKVKKEGKWQARQDRRQALKDATAALVEAGEEGDAHGDAGLVFADEEGNGVEGIESRNTQLKKQTLKLKNSGAVKVKGEKIDASSHKYFDDEGDAPMSELQAVAREMQQGNNNNAAGGAVSSTAE